MARRLVGPLGELFVTPATTFRQRAQFAVVVSNRVGSATSSAAMLTVKAANSAPSITTAANKRDGDGGADGVFLRDRDWHGAA